VAIKWPRVAVLSLSLSAAGFVALVQDESYTAKAVIPTKGDRPTVGFGSTFDDQGAPVKMGDTITPPAAVRRSYAHIAKDERGLKQCVRGDLYPTEYDLLVGFSYQYGVKTTCASLMVKKINAGDYVAACNAYRLYKKSQGRDCSRPEHWGPHGCKGVWLRNQRRAADCLGAGQ